LLSKTLCLLPKFSALFLPPPRCRSARTSLGTLPIPCSGGVTRAGFVLYFVFLQPFPPLLRHGSPPFCFCEVSPPSPFPWVGFSPHLLLPATSIADSFFRFLEAGISGIGFPLGNLLSFSPSISVFLCGFAFSFPFAPGKLLRTSGNFVFSRAIGLFFAVQALRWRLRTVRGICLRNLRDGLALVPLSFPFMFGRGHGDFTLPHSECPGPRSQDCFSDFSRPLFFLVDQVLPQFFRCGADLFLGVCRQVDRPPFFKEFPPPPSLAVKFSSIAPTVCIIPAIRLFLFFSGSVCVTPPWQRLQFPLFVVFAGFSRLSFSVA